MYIAQKINYYYYYYRKLVLKVDTGSDVNAINSETFQALFPGVELQSSSIL